jgi:FMN phosphatase YigB (HAD superfamily)
MNDIAPRAVVFDAYGTLFDVHAAIAGIAPQPVPMPSDSRRFGG